MDEGALKLEGEEKLLKMKLWSKERVEMDSRDDGYGGGKLSLKA